jgi:DNA-binding helix-hairpin-helix protein with protein kinase domain|tara:strand:- start:558 stop:818 length:261 start_codon:yes stop_codon:yes gene_type:complete
MKVKMFDKEWNVNSITYKEKRELWQLSLNAFRDDKENQDDYFKLINRVEELSGLTEKEVNSLTMAQVDLLLQQIFTNYMGLEKKDS